MTNLLTTQENKTRKIDHESLYLTQKVDNKWL